MTLYLVRHAHAGSRREWTLPDGERPLSPKGLDQAEALTALLAARHVSRVLSSSAIRCQQTVAPLAEKVGVEVEVHAALTEGATATQTTTLLWELASAEVDAVLSSHGDVIPAALDALATDGVEIGDFRGLPKGTLYELTVTNGAIVAAAFHDPRPSS